MTKKKSDLRDKPAVQRESRVTEQLGLVAKKDFVIRQEPYSRVILAGEDISDVPEKYHANLRTEGVL
jgi:hypothetical protein